MLTHDLQGGSVELSVERGWRWSIRIIATRTPQTEDDPVSSYGPVHLTPRGEADGDPVEVKCEECSQWHHLYAYGEESSCECGMVLTLHDEGVSQEWSDEFDIAEAPELRAIYEEEFAESRRPVEE